MHVVVNHLRLRDGVPAATVEALARDGVERMRAAGCPQAHVLRVDAQHLILVIFFAGAEDAERTAREVVAPGCASTWSRSSPPRPSAASAR